MQPGHQNWFLDPDADWAAAALGLGGAHHALLALQPAPLHAVGAVRAVEAERPALLVSNIQMQIDVPLILAAHRNGLPLVGYVASWDHTVGKGVIWPGMRRYLVQNEVMRSDLARYHGIDTERVVVTGWPQTDLFHRRRPRAAYEEPVEGYGLDPARPLVLVMGNTPTNAPYEAVRWRASSPGGSRGRARVPASTATTPPRPSLARALLGWVRPGGAYVQKPRYTDLETLATLLQHGDCVVSNAGTILLDSLVNNRPAVCVLYDEGAVPGESWAAKNVTGKHYEELIESHAFYRATTFDEVTAGIERALARPDELAGERARFGRDRRPRGRSRRRARRGRRARGTWLTYARLNARLFLARSARRRRTNTGPGTAGMLAGWSSAWKDSPPRASSGRSGSRTSTTSSSGEQIRSVPTRSRATSSASPPSPSSPAPGVSTSRSPINSGYPCCGASSTRSESCRGSRPGDDRGIPSGRRGHRARDQRPRRCHLRSARRYCAGSDSATGLRAPLGCSERPSSTTAVSRPACRTSRHSCSRCSSRCSHGTSAARPSRWLPVAMGVVVGYAATVRYFNAFFAAALVIGFACYRQLRPAATVALVSTGTFGLLAAIPLLVGVDNLTSGYAEDSSGAVSSTPGFSPETLIRMLFSDRGLFVWTPGHVARSDWLRRAAGRAAGRAAVPCPHGSARPLRCSCHTPSSRS